MFVERRGTTMGGPLHDWEVVGRPPPPPELCGIVHDQAQPMATDRWPTEKANPVDFNRQPPPLDWITRTEIHLHG
jgi:hypothetical protein